MSSIAVGDLSFIQRSPWSFRFHPISSAFVCSLSLAKGQKIIQVTAIGEGLVPAKADANTWNQCEGRAYRHYDGFLQLNFQPNSMIEIAIEEEALSRGTPAIFNAQAVYWSRKYHCWALTFEDRWCTIDEVTVDGVKFQRHDPVQMGKAEWGFPAAGTIHLGVLPVSSVHLFCGKLDGSKVRAVFPEGSTGSRWAIDA